MRGHKTGQDIALNLGAKITWFCTCGKKCVRPSLGSGEGISLLIKSAVFCGEKLAEDRFSAVRFKNCIPRDKLGGSRPNDAYDLGIK